MNWNTAIEFLMVLVTAIGVLVPFAIYFMGKVSEHREKLNNHETRISVAEVLNTEMNKKMDELKAETKDQTRMITEIYRHTPTK